MRTFAFGLFFFLSLFLNPLTVDAAASMFISPAKGDYAVGEAFNVLVNVDTGGYNINAATANLDFDATRLEVESVGYSRSIFSIWTEKPVFSNSTGKISFSGGVPTPGYSGRSGAILRVTFKAKAPGSAPVLITTASVLANDGKGTNIADVLAGGVFTITGEAKAGQSVSESPEETIDETVSVLQREIPAPSITEYPRSLEEGQSLFLKGLAFPGSKVLVYVQKGNTDPLVVDIIAGEDGKFSYQYDKPVETGFYRIWGRGVGVDGTPGDSSETVYVEVEKPLFLRIGGIALSYTSIIVTLFALLFFGFFVIAWMWRSMRRWQMRRGKEISEAEQALHRGFESMKTGLDEYVDYLKGAKKPADVKKRARRVREDVQRGIDEVERRIEKEIDDIK